MPFTEESLIARLPDLDRPARFWVAYSGGLDSHVLLAALSRLLARTPNRVSLHALHVNHGISPRAPQWQVHCREQCLALAVDFHARRVSLPDRPGESLETRARQARYQAFEAVLEDGDVLLQAHHQDDQVETILYRLCRGSGPKGLAGIPAERRLGRGRVVRPLLDFPRSELEDYARGQGLVWIEDESNTDPRFDRNYLRLELLPRIEARWPAFRDNWRRSARLCGEAAGLLECLAEQDLAAAATERPNVLLAAPLAALDPPRLRNLLRHWFARLGEQAGFPPPDWRGLDRIVAEVLPAAPDAVPLVSWSGGGRRAELRRFAGRLYALLPLESQTPGRVLEWPSPAPLALGPGLGTLRLVPVDAEGFSLEEAGPLEVRFREGGERAQVPGRPRRALKKILQESGVPPWLRDRLPLVHARGELLAVADLFIDERWLRERGDGLFRIAWERSDIHCGY